MEGQRNRAARVLANPFRQRALGRVAELGDDLPDGHALREIHVNGPALLLAARKLCGEVVDTLLEPHVDERLGWILRVMHDFGGELHVLLGREVGHQIVELEHEAEALRYVKREYAFFDALSRSGNDMQMYDRVKDVLKQMLLGQAARVGAELSYSGIPHDYALEILVSAVSSIIWLWIRRGCKEAPEQICAIIEKNKTTAPVYIIR